MFGDDERVDGSGRYLYSDWRYNSSTPAAARRQPGIVFSHPMTKGSFQGGMYDWLLSMSPEQIEEKLISFSDFHLDLLAVSSPSMRARVHLIRQRDPHIDTEQHCRELRSVLDRLRK